MHAQDELLAQARQSMAKAYSPYSKFQVGACIKTSKGKLFTGCNIENASYSLTLCAEAVAIAQMIHAGEQEIAEIAIIGSGDELCAPCGACRQRINEFATAKTLVHTYNKDGAHKTMTLAELLPMSFGPQHLNLS